MQRLPLSICALSLALTVACGYDSTTAPGPTPTPGDVNIVKGASQLTTTAFSPNPKQLSLGGATEVTVRWVNADGGGGYGGAAVVH